MPESLTIVAYHGDKPPSLASLITSVHTLLFTELGTSFLPRSLHDIHATIIGLERAHPRTLPASDTPPTHVDVGGLARHLCLAVTEHQLLVQFGGFADRDYPVTSRNRRMYERTLTYDRGAFVLIGWPVTSNRGCAEPLDILHTIRRGCEAYGAQHKYVDCTEATDPDVYMVVGHMKPDESRIESAIQHVLREYLRNHPTAVAMGPSDLKLARYTDPALPRETTETVPLCDCIQFNRFFKSWPTS